MKIAILDGYTLNPGDLSWDGFESLGDVTVYDRSPKDTIVERAQGAEVILTNKTVLDSDILKKLPNVKYIGVLATGVNVVDTEYAASNDITVTNVRNYSGLSTAQSVFSLLLELTNRVGHHSQTVSDGKWSQSTDFCYWDYPLVELDGATMGVVGYGGIGKAVARIALAFGMKVLINNRKEPENLPDGIQFADLDTLFSKSDVVTLHCPLTKDTEGMINSKCLSEMKSTAYLINISRGGLVVEKDLAEALDTDQIAGAGLDVLCEEPADPSNPLLKAKNCYITPHIAWATFEARQRLMDIAVDNLRSYLEGNPKNVVT